jgi:CxxC motif-containing protein (DUF1111 family)
MSPLFALFVAVAILLPGRADAASEARIKEVVESTDDFSTPEKYELMQGGAGTSRKKVNADAYSHHSQNLAFEKEMDFKVGNAFFRRLWVSAPASTQASDGLGPLFNAKSCQRCHLKDGRGHPPAGPDEEAISMFLRLSVPPRTEEARAKVASGHASVIPEPTYGAQLQDFAIQGHTAEGRFVVDYEEVPVTLADGAVVTLRKPTYRIEDLGYGPMQDDVMISPRVAPPMIGMGLLETIAEEDILAAVDPDDADGDGISGRANRIWNFDTERMELGRFGWKAGTSSIRVQTATAFRGDIGISSTLTPQHWGECTEAQTACREGPHGDTARLDGVEASDDVLDLVTFYSRNLAVPARRDVGDAQVLKGKKVFYRSGCIACHRPKYVTATDDGRPEHSHQLIWPYTDLLLHDMGEGLADHRPEARADGREWRTPPLWGIGLTKEVSGHTLFLHDGRARSLLEAILWHGGEAEAAKQRVVELPKEQRDALIRFLESL